MENAFFFPKNQFFLSQYSYGANQSVVKTRKVACIVHLRTQMVCVELLDLQREDRNGISGYGVFFLHVHLCPKVSHRETLP